jgi:hypothetical protein
MVKITLRDVVNAYALQLAARAREVNAEYGDGETDSESNQRQELIFDHNILELQYLAQFAPSSVDTR